MPRDPDRFGDGVSQERRVPKWIAFEAMKAGAVNSAIFGTPITCAVLLLNKHSKAFQTKLGMSGKLATCVIGFAFPFFLASEHRVIELSRESSMIQVRASEAARRLEEARQRELLGPQVPVERLTLTGKAVDFLVDYPFRVFFGLTLPTVGTILAYNMKQTHLKFSHRLVHTRVQGQAAALVILATTMLLNQVCSTSRGKLARGKEERGYNGFNTPNAVWRTKEWERKQEEKKKRLEKERAAMLERNRAAVKAPEM
eukprot:g565.t1